MAYWWVTFADENATVGCVEAPTVEEAERLASELTGLDVYHCGRLPYPAYPRLNEVSGLSGSPCPSFCFQPGRCVGLRVCPRPIACSS